MRFLRPVRLGDTIRVETQVEEKIAREDGGGRVVLKVEVINQSEQPVLALQMIFLVAGCNGARSRSEAGSAAS